MDKHQTIYEQKNHEKADSERSGQNTSSPNNEESPGDQDLEEQTLDCHAHATDQEAIQWQKEHE